MAMHWWRAGRGVRQRIRLGINGIGTLVTGLALAVILVAKFMDGAWLTLLVIPLTVLLLRLVHRYHETLDRLLLCDGERPTPWRDTPPLVIIPMSRWDRVAAKAVGYAFHLSPDITALHCVQLEGPDAEERQAAEMRRQWHEQVEVPARRAGLPAPWLLVVRSPFRQVIGPLLRTIAELRRNQPGRPITVLLPQLVGRRWWEALLHAHRGRRLRHALLRQGGGDLFVGGVPWTIDQPGR